MSPRAYKKSLPPKMLLKQWPSNQSSQVCGSSDIFFSSSNSDWKCCFVCPEVPLIAFWIQCPFDYISIRVQSAPRNHEQWPRTHPPLPSITTVNLHQLFVRRLSLFLFGGVNSLFLTETHSIL